MYHFISDFQRVNMYNNNSPRDPRMTKVNDPKSIYYRHPSLMTSRNLQQTGVQPGYKTWRADSMNHSTSDYQREQQSKMAKETKSIYYHYTFLKKQLSDEDIQLIKPLEDSLRQQGKLKPAFGSCYYCHSTSHWASDCSVKKNGECFKCGSLDHWASDCTMKDDEPLDIPPSPRSLERKTEKPSSSEADPMKKSDSGKKRKYPFEETSDATPSKQRKTEKTTEPRVTRKKPTKKQHCFICKSETHSAKDCGDGVSDSDEELRQTLRSLTLEHDA